MASLLLALAAATAVIEIVKPAAAETLTRAMRTAFTAASTHTIEFKLTRRDDLNRREYAETGTLRLARTADGRWVGRGSVVSSASKEDTPFAVRGGRLFALYPDRRTAIDLGESQAFGFLMGLLQDGPRPQGRLLRTGPYYHILHVTNAGRPTLPGSAGLAVMAVDHPTIPRHLPRAYQWSDGLRTEYYEITSWRRDVAGPTATTLAGEMDGWAIGTFLDHFLRAAYEEQARRSLIELGRGLRTLVMRSVPIIRDVRW